jgi:hypothetical protein
MAIIKAFMPAAAMTPGVGMLEKIHDLIAQIA